MTDVSRHPGGCGADPERGGTSPHLRDHLPPGRGQDHADREAPAVRRAARRGRRRGRQAHPPGRHVGLHGDRAPPRDLGLLHGAALRARRGRAEPARHPRPPRLLRGHAARAQRGRRRGHAARRGARRGAADAAALRGRARPRHPAADVHQQVRPPGHGAAGDARPRGVRAGHRAGRGDLAGRDPRRLPRRRRPLHGRVPPVHAHPGRSDGRTRGDPDAGAGARPRGRRVEHRAGGARAPGRRGRAVRRRRVLARRLHARLLRLGGLELRRAPAAGGRRAPRPGAAPSRDARRRPAADRRAVLGARLQGPGQHGPQAPRPRRLPARVLGALRARDEGDQRPHRAAVRAPPRPPRLRRRARGPRRRLPGRRGRRGQRR